MPRGEAKRLTKYCKERAGDKLRSVTIYRPEGTTSVYVREGLREDYTEEQVAALVKSATELNSTLHRSNIEDAPLGRPNAGVYSFEEAFVIQLPLNENSGIVATFDADVGSYLAGFIRDCQKAIQGDPSLVENLGE